MNPMDMLKEFPKFKADMEKQHPGMSPQDMVNKMVQLT